MISRLIKLGCSSRFSKISEFSHDTYHMNTSHVHTASSESHVHIKCTLHNLKIQWTEDRVWCPIYLSPKFCFSNIGEANNEAYFNIRRKVEMRGLSSPTHYRHPAGYRGWLFYIYQSRVAFKLISNKPAASLSIRNQR